MQTKKNLYLVPDEKNTTSEDFVNRLISESERGVENFVRSKMASGDPLTEREAQMVAGYLDIFRNFRETVKASFRNSSH
jgi:hypothetical protein